MSAASTDHGSPRRPMVSPSLAMDMAERHWGTSGPVVELPGDRDRNFRIGEGVEAIVLKVTDAPEAVVELSVEALNRLGESGGSLAVGQALPTHSGDLWTAAEGEDGRGHLLWAVRWVEGVPLADAGARSPALLGELGSELGMARRSLDGWEHPAMDRDLKWDLRRGLEVAWGLEGLLDNPLERGLIRETLASVEVALEGVADQLRVGVIHGDANDHNILVSACEPAAGPCGLLDVGDIDRSWILGEVSIASAYLMLDADDPIQALVDFTAGYHKSDPIPPDELGHVFDLARLRLCVSVTVAADQRSGEPENDYLSVTAGPALELLGAIQRVDRAEVHRLLSKACGVEFVERERGHGDLLARRTGALPSSLSLSYEDPIEVVRGEGRYLIERGGRSYLDAVNNVPHVGHCHPAVVDAAARQMRTLNTNSRYLSEVRMSFVERLLDTFPHPLEVAFLVNSGSEANELARRLVSAHQADGDWIVLEGGYHGNTEGLVELSHYKFSGPGGAGASERVRVASLPDRHRGTWGYDEADAGLKYAQDVARCVDECAADGRPVSAFLAESIPGCAGQVVLPEGYLQESYRLVREAGGLVVADEVQVGCGRVGTHWWAFETQGVCPDIVTVGKPLGNGHPLGAVVTTREVAEAFDSGMEYFNTFGGNPVSCAAGEAVMRVIEDQGLMANAAETGALFLRGLEDLMTRHDAIGDVRGLGLYLGAACVKDRSSRDPDPLLAAAVVEASRRRGVLLSTDGMDHDVIKMKPPMVFRPSDAAHVLEVLDACFVEVAGGS